jgi:Cdc6-like AAA superfamily ATPase
MEEALSRLDIIIGGLGDSSRKRSRDEETSTEEEGLYRLLYPCLVEHKTNSAAFIMGGRGSGKSRLVENCLARMDQSKFRVLRLNGLVIRGNDVGFAVHELVRQLSVMGFSETGHKDNDLLRLKKTSFTSDISLLDEAFRLAKVDKRPILIILDEMDAFAGSSAALDTAATVEKAGDRQVLLYHLLDRVATPGSSLCFIGITSHLAAVGLLEKRIRSRAEGTSKTFFVKPFDSYATLTRILTQKVELDEDIRSKLGSWLNLGAEKESPTMDDVALIFERNYRLGKDLRWFLRVLLVALCLYREEIRESLAGEASSSVSFQPRFLMEALSVMGASTTGSEGLTVYPDRIQALQDLSGPQVALLLAARRILARDSQDEDTPNPLTLERMLNEYQCYRGHANRYSQGLLLRSFGELLDLGVLRPSSDHSGGGPMQYEFGNVSSDMDPVSLSMLPLHLPYELDAELTKAIKDNLLDCSTALQDWGKAKNN